MNSSLFSQKTRWQDGNNNASPSPHPSAAEHPDGGYEWVRQLLLPTFLPKNWVPAWQA
jgi:hypothetical protein